jgi:hypothetical protein
VNEPTVQQQAAGAAVPADAAAHANVQQALVFNALSRTLSAANHFVPLRARVRVTQAVLAALHSGPPSWLGPPAEGNDPLDDFAGMVMMLIDFAPDGTSHGTSWAVDDPVLAAHLHHLSSHMGEPMTSAGNEEVDAYNRERYTGDTPAHDAPVEVPPTAVGATRIDVDLYVQGALTADELVERVCARFGGTTPPPAEGATA